MKSNAPISFDGYTWRVNYRSVANLDTLIEIFKQHFSEPPKVGFVYELCQLRWIPDGDQVWIVGCDQVTHIPFNSTCQNCSVPLDVHGTCCGWRNAKHTCDPRSLRIVDDRHPWYNKNLNDYLNSLNA